MGWTTKMVLKYINEFKIKYTQGNITKILHKCNLSLITPRSQHKKDSKLARYAFKEEMGKKLQNQYFGHSIVMFDEVSFQLCPELVGIWGFKRLKT